MNDKLPFILAIAMAALALGLYTWDSSQPVSVAEGKLSDIPVNIFLPEMEFETLSDSDNAALRMCRESANTIVYKFALETFPIEERVWKLRTLGRIAFSECLKLYSLKVVEVD